MPFLPTLLRMTGRKIYSQSLGKNERPAMIPPAMELSEARTPVQHTSRSRDPSSFIGKQWIGRLIHYERQQSGRSIRTPIQRATRVAFSALAVLNTAWGIICRTCTMGLQEADYVS
jgi:hypothetical protein